MTRQKALELALSVLEPFQECSSYEDYQREDGWTDEEYGEMIRELQQAKIDIVVHEEELAHVPGLAKLAAQNGWSPSNLIELFGFGPDRVDDRSISGIIAKAVKEGDDAEWIEEVVSLPPKTKF